MAHPPAEGMMPACPSMEKDSVDDLLAPESAEGAEFGEVAA